MGLGGLKLAELSGEQREVAKLPRKAMALQVEHAGEYGEHAVAKRAGFRKGDILVCSTASPGRCPSRTCWRTPCRGNDPAMRWP